MKNEPFKGLPPKTQTAPQVAGGYSAGAKIMCNRSFGLT